MADVGRLEVTAALIDFVANELTPDSGVTAEEFWASFETIATDLGPRYAALLDRREELQHKIDSWHVANRENANRGHYDSSAYIEFLREIGYLQDEPRGVAIKTRNVDSEITSIAAPQLVVPLDNARYALNAANARWGSFYDALYGTDVIGDEGGAEAKKSYNPVRGSRVIAYARAFLDRHMPLEAGSHADATAYTVTHGSLTVTLADKKPTALEDPSQFVGYMGDPDTPTSVLLRKHGLHLSIEIDRSDSIGRDDAAGVSDLLLEAAVTTIMDCEDSVAAVDAQDRVVVYRNWLGLLKGTLTSSFERAGETINRRLNPDRSFTAPDGSPLPMAGRALMLVRNTGHHIRTDAVAFDGEPVFETILDTMVTSLAAKHDLDGNGKYRNSHTGSVYIVKPKLHGPDEVALACDLFDRVEDALKLERHTLKMGIMDEERRMSLNLAAAVDRAEERVVFINTGFLDRTGDGIHTDMEAGPVLPKAEIKGATWFSAYEDNNVDAGLACGFANRAQIGKGMWAQPSDMAEMLASKIDHPNGGATCAWVPSPTAATLHATHYFEVDVAARQDELSSRPRRTTEDLTAIPLLDRDLSAEEIQTELDNNAQSILGYIVRWVGSGVGCSTVPNIHNVGLMEDLATLRISSQHVANWLHHGILDEAQVRATMTRIAAQVDQQNADDPSYQPMAPDPDASIPYQAALSLVFGGRDEPNGYTERILRNNRLRMKATA
ncbi:MAG: malate synthase G [Acidimicrobiaceae bacterium]|nr:malate synthase G [Acidimicrobiaceae bacterium]MDE0608199.1 malate synthase G [Acidimicrobiaceae bacterium]